VTFSSKIKLPDSLVNRKVCENPSCNEAPKHIIHRSMGVEHKFCSKDCKAEWCYWRQAERQKST